MTIRHSVALIAGLLLGAGVSAQDPDPMRPPALAGQFEVSQFVREVRDDAGAVVETWYQRGGLWWHGERIELWQVRDADGQVLLTKSGVYFWGPGIVEPVRDPLTNVDPLSLHSIPAPQGHEIWLIATDGTAHRVLP